MTTLMTLLTTTPGLPCRTAPDRELFFSDYPIDRYEATRRCRACPLLLACRSHAVETGETWGVWGGRDFTVVETYCGTERGHLIHRRNGETACDPCIEAHVLLVDGGRRARLDAEHAKGGTVRGYELHRVLAEASCGACLGAVAARSAANRERRARARGGPLAPRVAPGPTDHLPHAPAPVQTASRAA